MHKRKPRLNPNGQLNRHGHPNSSGFTLVELLVVIGIIALLIAILLPALNRARTQSQAVACLSNIRQCGMAMFLYATDNKCIPGSYWQGIAGAGAFPNAPENLDWCGKNNLNYTSNPGSFANPIMASVLKKYMVNDRIMECPVADRPNGVYDYTMVIRLAGARTNLPYRMSYPAHPELSSSPLKYFPAIPLLVEESQFFNNVPIPDGSFANDDQFSARHPNWTCNIAYLDGSAGSFSAPHGPKPGVVEPPDLTCNNLLLETRWGSFSVSHSDATEFGWANNPAYFVPNTH